jgi:hypothetical protein
VWLFFAVQLGIATPLLFVAFLSALKGLATRGAKGDDRAQLLGAFAIVPLGLFLVASPFETTELARHHWPIPGYIPLLVFVPFVLRRFVRRGHRHALRRAVALAAPGLGILLVLLFGLEIMTGLFNTAYRRPFSGWPEVTRAVEKQIGSRDLIVVADNYKLGGNIEFESKGRITPYVLKHPKNVEHGRAPQFETWDLGEDALHECVGRDALVVIQTKELRSEDREAWRQGVAARFVGFESVGKVAVYVGGRSVKFELIHATGVRAR